MQFIGRTSLLLATALVGACTSTGKLEVRAIPDKAAAITSASNSVAEAQGQLALGNVGLALEAFRKLQRNNPTDLGVLVGIGDCYVAMGRLDIARSSYETALAVSPHNPELLFALAAILDSQGDHVRAGEARADASGVAPAMLKTGSAVEPARIAHTASSARALAPKPVPAILIVDDRQFLPRLERLTFGEVALVTAVAPANLPLPVADRPKALAARPSAVLLATMLLSPEPAPRSRPFTDPMIAEAEHAIEAGRVEQARVMAARLSAKGSAGPTMDRLLANLEFAAGNLDQALARYELLLDSGQRDESICDNGARAAVRLGQAQRGRSFADCAIELSPQSAQAWNMRAVIADLMEDWATADSAYVKARALSPDSADVLNNEGWSMLLRGRWTDALPLLQHASSLEPNMERVRNNLELAKVAVSTRLPERVAGESESAWAMRLNDAGVAARLTGDRTRAFAAFTQAIAANPTWYTRAWNNLQLAKE